ncbi:hypothetical protein GCM10010995_00570 [Cysteiniphilum litorale]|uniref:RCK N-terminal domain-containing protein n=1 Tax=Cysteiniphilum litorale TaxID=2056700 RepID=A0A8J3E7C6_9GAMM|nr:NAD-binding protein [Cysteiniphilum litorale]GGF87083.1 hypothetical protein GCM10010995_00570 [Cysteiniphilum litorale]
MKIIILGAGQVGSSLAKNLQKDHNISVVDERAERLRHIQNHFDVKTICARHHTPIFLKKQVLMMRI